MTPRKDAPSCSGYHKTPGIYVLHALSVKVFGEVMWGIRVIDLVVVVAMAFVVAWLAAAPGKPITKGAVGRAALFTPWLVVLARCITPPRGTRRLA